MVPSAAALADEIEDSRSMLNEYAADIIRELEAREDSASILSRLQGVHGVVQVHIRLFGDLSLEAQSREGKLRDEYVGYLHWMAEEYIPELAGSTARVQPLEQRLEAVQEEKVRRERIVTQLIVAAQEEPQGPPEQSVGSPRVFAQRLVFFGVIVVLSVLGVALLLWAVAAKGKTRQ